MKKKLLLISCIAAIGMSLAACGDGSSSSSASSSKAEATLSVASSTEDSNASSEDVSGTVNADSTEDGRVTDGTESDIPEIDEPVSADGDNEQTVTAKEYIEKMVNNVKDNKNVHIESTVDTSFEMAADQQNISFTNKSKISADSTDNGIHFTTVSTTSQDKDEVKEETEGYVTADGEQYISTDGGKTWTKNDSASVNFDSTVNGIFGDESGFGTAEIAENGEGYTIEMAIDNIKGLGGIAGSELGDNTSMSGKLAITMTKDYYPLTINIYDLSINATEEGQSAGVKMNMSITYSQWDEIADEAVAIPEGVIK